MYIPGKFKYCLIFIDTQMPEMDGLEATARIRRRSDPVKSLLIVALTALAMTGDWEKFIKATISDDLSKPLVVEAIKTLLKRFFRPA